MLSQIFEAIFAALVAAPTLEIISVLFGLAYVVLAARENIWCWPAAFIGTGTAVVLFWDVSLVMESALNVYYLAMAVFGWWQWQYGGSADQSTQRSVLKIQSWSLKQHAIAFAIIAGLTAISGYLLDRTSEAAWPYVDSFTTWSAVVGTWMVARKVLENWLYWVVIDLISIWLYAERGLFLYAALFVVYSIIAVFAYIRWRGIFNAESANIKSARLAH